MIEPGTGCKRETPMFVRIAATLFIAGMSLVVHAQGTDTRIVRLPQNIQFTGPGTTQTTVLYGDLTKSGMYVYRTRFFPGAKSLPHRHQDERTVIIISGTLYYGLGEQWDDDKLVGYPPGTFLYEPPKMPHFAWAKDGEVILQVTGIGPSITTSIQQ
jgi:quercetin dioxygenase-like cupin family protein